MADTPHGKKPRLLFIVDYYSPHLGGLEIVFENIITRLVTEGYKIGIITIKPTKTLPTYENAGQIEIWRVGKNRISFLWKALMFGLKVASQYDVIHTTTYAAAIPASIIGRLRTMPVILTIHEVFGTLRKRYKPYRWKLFKFFEQIIFWFPYSHKVCVSEYTKQMVHRLFKIPNKELAVISNGIDTSIRNEDHKDPERIARFKSLHKLDGHFIGLYYGHSGASKGLDYFVRSLPEIIKAHPHFKAVLNIIPGRRDHKIYSLIKKLQLENYITLLHGLQQTDLVNLVYMADFVIVPSISDGFGLVAAEVSQLNKPLIVTRNGALPEVVSGKVVFLVDLSPSSITEGVSKVKRKQRHHIPRKEFSWENTVKEYEEIYKNYL